MSSAFLQQRNIVLNLDSLSRPMARLVSALPAYPPSLIFAAAGSLFAWPALRDLDWKQVLGRRFCVHVRDTGLRVYFSVRSRGFRAERSGPVDVTFTASSLDLTRLLLRLEDPDTLFFDRRLLIEGDTDLGLRVKNMLDGVDLDAALDRLPAPLGVLMSSLRRLASG